MVYMWEVWSNGYSVKCMSCGKIHVLEYFQLLDMRYDDRMWSPKELVQQSCNFT